MARVQMSVEELLQLIKGEADFSEAKKAIAERLTDVWASEEMNIALKEKSEEIARRTMRDVIDKAFKVTENGWGANRRNTFSGWATELVKEYIQTATVEAIVQQVVEQVVQRNLQPEIEKTINQVIGKMLIAKLAEEQEQK